jgi:alkylhydroperoxidase family enzyme
MKSPNPVPDEVYKEAALHYDETALAMLITGIATINMYNRINVSTRQIVDVLSRK